MKTRHPQSLRAGVAALALLALTAMPLARAEPAPWYLWVSNTADGLICAQISPGEDWRILRGPFRDGLCRKQGVPG
ncbi:hypothetical protein [Rhodocyclus gracilis]|uniref:Uncharacterized protein n=1 Tax=Rhodocyclus tenuis TaxID=1066 RepID=A0A6L5JYN6_RHOTE|nr:hypothetical protein [Rhodocyclus gracilis]MQY51328.1 hypothetical protein [Rhodocyclus gracilis]